MNLRRCETSVVGHEGECLLCGSAKGEACKKPETCPSCGGNGINPEGLSNYDGLLADCEICDGRGIAPTRYS